MAIASTALRGPQWAAALSEQLALQPCAPADWMARHTRLVKSDTYSRAGLLELRGQSCFLKLYLAKSLSQRLAFRMGLARGPRSFDAAQRLAAAGLAVPSPRCCLLVPGGLMLLTEALTGGSDLRAMWRSAAAASERVAWLQAAADTVAALHRAGFAHGDCKWDNLLWYREQFYLVDLEAVSGGRLDSGSPRPPGRRQLRDLARFTVDAEEQGVSGEQYGLFLSRYAGQVGGTPPGLEAGIAPFAAKIRRRHLRRYGRRGEPLV